MNTRTFRVALSFAALTVTSQAFAAELTLPRDGWTSWQVAAVEGAPDLCCWSSWDDANPMRTACALDDNRGNSGSRDHTTTDAVRVYARVAGGKVERLRVFSASCPVKADTEIQPLGNVSEDDSARWLVKLFKSGADWIKHEDSRESLLTALALHRGDFAFNELAAIARSDARTEAREKAVFWLAHLRGNAGAEVATSVMFNDQDADIRKHAAFSITQSKSPRVASDLIRLGNTDKDGDVRAQAWFWLAQSGYASAEEAIFAAIRKDADEDVSERAIFALSQLPDDRGTKALITVAEDKTLSGEQRKRALFWLAQSESEGAQKYLEKILVGKTAN
ncbi:MAG TPA: HEAT repeat domain-containing protein [Steroidobacteraceae bacterium]